MSKTNTGLVAYAKTMVGHPYWYGTYGQISTKDLYYKKKKQYPNYYQWSLPASQLGVRVFDCIGLIKGYLWSDGINSNPKYNPSQDVSANQMRGKCTKSGKMSTLPEVEGILLFSQGHVGVYIGNGYAIEARGHAYGVVKTKVKDRGWTSWGYCPWITYEKPNTPVHTMPVNSKYPTYKIGHDYVLQADMNVRTGAGTNYSRKKRSQLTTDGKKHAKIGYYAILKKGTKVTIKAIKTGNNEAWAQIPSGWICLYRGNRIYVK